ncbi:MAG: hypothetical protein A3E78_05570 [Alphaproteobacteria bacterium RIFCSPHIGHO2_12_FULL_63_12]|nr:MAG: hypothetical protein A3E78_05570 [Alphaproteobacteria bacterium RIFCSPHIGHO2_12_FULL_63_12]
MSQTQGAPQITGKMFLFEQPELLNIEQHRELGIDPAKKPFDFCSKIRAVPLTISEIPEASKRYPVVFMSKEEPVPLAIVGFHDDNNLFVDDDGNWENYAYIPGYLRRYPFALAGESGGGDRLAFVVDRAYEGVSTESSRKLFQNGELSDFAKQAMEFTRTYESDRRLTDQLMKALKKYDIIQPQTAQYTPAGETEPRPFTQYFGIDEQKLTALSDQQFLELRQMNIFGVIYSHIHSLANWRDMISRRMRRFKLSEREAISGARPA